VVDQRIGNDHDIPVGHICLVRVRPEPHLRSALTREAHRALVVELVTPEACVKVGERELAKLVAQRTEVQRDTHHVHEGGAQHRDEGLRGVDLLLRGEAEAGDELAQALAVLCDLVTRLVDVFGQFRLRPELEVRVMQQALDLKGVIRQCAHRSPQITSDSGSSSASSSGGSSGGSGGVSATAPPSGPSALTEERALLSFLRRLDGSWNTCSTTSKPSIASFSYAVFCFKKN